MRPRKFLGSHFLQVCLPLPDLEFLAASQGIWSSLFSVTKFKNLNVGIPSSKLIGWRRNIWRRKMWKAHKRWKSTGEGESIGNRLQYFSRSAEKVGGWEGSLFLNNFIVTLFKWCLTPGTPKRGRLLWQTREPRKGKFHLAFLVSPRQTKYHCYSVLARS